MRNHCNISVFDLKLYHVLKWRQEDRGRDGLMMRDGRSFVTERRNLATGLVVGAEIL